MHGGFWPMMLLLADKVAGSYADVDTNCMEK